MTHSGTKELAKSRSRIQTELIASLELTDLSTFQRSHHGDHRTQAVGQEIAGAGARGMAPAAAGVRPKYDQK